MGVPETESDTDDSDSHTYVDLGGFQYLDNDDHVYKTPYSGPDDEDYEQPESISRHYKTRGLSGKTEAGKEFHSLLVLGTYEDMWSWVLDLGTLTKRMSPPPEVTICFHLPEFVRRMWHDGTASAACRLLLAVGVLAIIVAVICATQLVPGQKVS
ncbi:hypothetical protein Bbelb_397670 [Branchiostoma belcheri]|nr:hypothetical protein Bbelb_397670 [Branchiostoma belcheri]